jgi:hypothetical protein
VRSLKFVTLTLCAAAAACVLTGPRPASAQPEVEPWRPPEPAVVAEPRKATSGIEATKRVPTPTEQRQAHALTMAIFAKPGAAARATARVDAANQPALSDGQPRTDWTADKGGVGMGGQGVEYRKPF